MTCKTVAPPSTVEEMIAKAGACWCSQGGLPSRLAFLTCMNFVSHLHGGLDNKIRTSKKNQLHLECFFYFYFYFLFFECFFVPNLLKTLCFFLKGFRMNFRHPNASMWWLKMILNFMVLSPYKTSLKMSDLVGSTMKTWATWSLTRR